MPPVFTRLTGVSPDTFLAMSLALAAHLPCDARPATHCLQDLLLITLFAA